MAARDEYPELKRLDAARADLSATMPSPSAPLAAWDAWFARRNTLRDELAAVMAEVGENLCTRCSGTGLTTFSRHNGMCYRCQGDGWSAKGRRAIASASK